MVATKYDILDLVVITVKHLTNGIGKTLHVRLDGDNILIGGKPVSLADIEANRHNARGFVKLIRGVMYINI